MISTKKVVRHTGIVMVMELGIRLTDALVSIMLARYLAPEGFGLLAFALSFANLFGMLPGFGMGTLAIRDIARNPEQVGRYMGNGLYAKVGLSALTLLLIGATSWMMGFPLGKTEIVLLAGLFMVTETAMRFTTSFFQAVQKPGMAARVNLLTRAGWLAGSLGVMAAGGGIPQLIGIRVLVTAIGLVLSVILVEARLKKIDWRLDLSFIKKMLTDSFPFVLFRLKGKMTGDMDTVMISLLRDDLMTGWYSAAQKLLRVFSFVPTSFSQAILPILSKSMVESTEEVKDLLRKSIRLLLIISFPIAGVGCILAGEITRFIYGPAYVQAADALRILAWSVPFLFLNNGSLVAAIGAAGEEKAGVKIVLIGGLFSTLSNFIVVPLYGHVGAASTSVIGEVFIAVMQIRLLQRALPGVVHFRQFAGLLGPAAGMMAAAFLMRSLFLPVALAGSVAAYAGLLFLFKQVQVREIAPLFNQLRKKT